MATKRRYVDVMTVNLRYTEDSVEQPSFEDILSSLDAKSSNIDGKLFELKLISTTIPNCIIGLIITTQDKDIPPKRDKTTGNFSSLNLNPATEGLAFGNIFIYDKVRKVLIYEINKNGCYIKNFELFTYKIWNSEHDDIKFDIKFPTIIRGREYDRLLNMNYYKEFTVELTNPAEIMSSIREENDSISNNIIHKTMENSIKANSDYISFKQRTLPKKYNLQGITRAYIKDIADYVINNIISTGQRKNVQKFVVNGYTEDHDGRASLKPINLIADTFDEYFKIKEIQILSDLQELDRKDGITKLYEKLQPELITIIGH